MIRKVLFLTAIVFAFAATAAMANAPNPTHVWVDSATQVTCPAGSNATNCEQITLSGTWTWDQTVPNGAQSDCNDSRIGVGYAIDWGDNTANPVKQGNTTYYVGDAADDWVHSVTQVNSVNTYPDNANDVFVDGPFKNGIAQVAEPILTGSLESFVGSFANDQGIPANPSGATPDNADAANWYSNCGPTPATKVGPPSNPTEYTVGNSVAISTPGATAQQLQQGYPNGEFGPISHIYTGAGPYTICPVLYDPHQGPVGTSASGNSGQIIAGGNGANNDNSLQANNNVNPCPLVISVPSITTTANPSSTTTGSSISDSAKITGSDPQGTMTWQLYGPFSSSAAITANSCTAANLTSGQPTFSQTINGNGTYSPVNSFTPTTAGVYQWVASFTANANSTDISVGPTGCGPTEASEQVNVTTAPAPGFTIQKLQQIGSGGTYVTSQLTGLVGQTINYEIVVDNTGNTSLTFSNFSDPNCSNITGGPGSTPVASLSSTTFLCSHVITSADQSAGSYDNTATITGTPPGGPSTTTPSNTVVVTIPSVSFTIQKLQQIGTGGTFTTSTLTGAVGQTVNYEIVVTNTSTVPLTFSSFTDAHCDAGTIAGGPGNNPVAANGGTTTYTCDHVLTSTDQTNGSYSNTASDTGTPPSGDGPPVTNTSNTVVVDVPTPSAPGIASQKYQHDSTSDVPANANCPASDLSVGGTCYTDMQINGVNVGDTISYLITTTNTGNTSLTLNTNSLNDPAAGGVGECDAGTRSAPFLISGNFAGGVLGTASTAGFTCAHVITTTDETNGSFTNTATVTGTPPSGPPITSPPTSVTVTVNVPGLTIVKSQRDVTSNVPSDGSYTTSTINGAVGDTISYHITVTNTGDTPLALVLNDSPCDPASIQGPFLVTGTLTGSTLSAQGVAYFSCSHVLSAADGSSFTNTATVTGTPPGGTPITTPPSSVVVNIPPPPPPPTTTPTPGFTVVKEQKLSTSPASAYTTAPITATVGSTVDYEIILTDTGQTTLALNGLNDAKCDAGTIVSPPVTSISPGQTATWTCTHVVLASDTPAITNVAIVTVTPPGGTPLSGQAAVVANIPAQGVLACTAAVSNAKLQTTKTKTSLKAVVTGKNIATVTFFLDGRKVKTLTKSNVKGGGFGYTVTLKQTSYGKHQLTAMLTQSNCTGPLEAKAAFKRAAPAKLVIPKFTG